MDIIRRIRRHVRLSLQAVSNRKITVPPFLTLFINSVCNLKCGHCFYWKSLNKKNDLTYDEIIAFANEYGNFENLNLSGGEPFLREESGEICKFFIRNNLVKQVYIPTNAYFPDKIHYQTKKILTEPDLQLLVIEISLDGMQEFHNTLRGDSNSFEKAMESYKMLKELQKKDERLRIHSISTVTSENVAEIAELTEFLYKQCPSIDHHGISIMRGDWKNKRLLTPEIEAYRNLSNHLINLWKSKEKGRFGSSVAPMIQWAKCKAIIEQQQPIPCLAGRLSAVVYANGNVSVCELRNPVGNLRKKTFSEIWYSPEVQQLRNTIKTKSCYCTHEIPLWSSIAFQPYHLMRAIIGTRF